MAERSWVENQWIEENKNNTIAIYSKSEMQKRGAQGKVRKN